MKIRGLIVLCLIFMLVCALSAQKNRGKEDAEKPFTLTAVEQADSTDECILMKEICDAAMDFQNEYREITDKELKKEMVKVLNSYVNDCERARKNCSRSMK